MNKRSKIKHHVRTNIVARIIYRVICLALIAIGIVGLVSTYNTADMYTAYGRRDNTTTATVTDFSKSTDKYGYDSCTINYKFNVSGTEYTHKTSWHHGEANNYNCNTSKDSEISVRFESANPANNAYGDNEADELTLVIIVIVTIIISAVALGIGFVGLIAIHNAMKEEEELEEAEEARTKHRNNRKSKKSSSDEQTI